MSSIPGPPAMSELADYFRREQPPLAAEPDLAEWPEDVRETVGAVCRVFNLRPPMRTKRKAGEFALWIQDSRELTDACRPFPVLEVLEEVQRDLTLELHQGRGWMVAGPGSLRKAARAKAAQMTARQLFVDNLGNDPILEDDPLVPCPRCGKRVWEERLTDDCRAH